MEVEYYLLPFICNIIFIVWVDLKTLYCIAILGCTLAEEKKFYDFFQMSLSSVVITYDFSAYVPHV